MKFETLTGNKRSRRNRANLSAPAVVEALEVRSLLTSVALTGPVEGPPLVINDATPTMTWAIDNNASSYDLWITDAEQRSVELVQRGITQASFTPTNNLSLGLTRVWFRSNYANGSSSSWSPPTQFVVDVTPTVTGPLNSQSTLPRKLTETKPTITWTSPPGAVRFEIFLQNLTTLSGEKTSLNVTPALGNTPVRDENGVAVLEADGNIPRQAESSYQLPDDLLMGSYQVFVRSLNDAGKYSEWSAGHRFEVAPQVNVLRPAAPTYQSSHTVELTISGTPTSGSYAIELAPVGAGGFKLKTAPLPYNATSAQVQAAVRLLNGFGTTEVTTTGTSPNVTHRLTFPVKAGPGAASVTSNFNSGTVTSRISAAQKILLEWEPVEGATNYEIYVGKLSTSGAVTGLYSAHTTTTSYQIPNLLQDADYVFWVRAERRSQVTEIKLTGTPTSGSYRIVLTTSGIDGTTQQTAPISYAATASQIKAAVNSLNGFKNADVISYGTTPNVRHLLQIPLTADAVTVNVVGSLDSGTLTHLTYSRPKVVGLWSEKSKFSTFRDPVVLAPVGPRSGITGLPLVNSTGQPLVTDARPVIKWTPIDQAARYEIWVNVSDGTAPYLTTRSSTDSYQFEQDIRPGKYEVWVRATLTTGVLTGWSKAYAFQATGGAPIITSPAANAAVTPIPNITWTAVPNAASYEIWFAWVGQDFDYIVDSGIATTSYAPTSPLPTGSYRVWVRAITPEGSALPWSAEVTFSVAENEVEWPVGGVPELLAALLMVPDGEQSDVVADNTTKRSIELEVADSLIDSHRVSPGSIASIPSNAMTPDVTAETDALIEQLAQRCTTAEWWMPQGSES